MPLAYHIAFLVWAWDALSFGATAFLAFRSHRRGEYVWGGWLTGVLALDIALIFLLHVLQTPALPIFSSADFGNTAGNLLEFAVPALLVHAFYVEERHNMAGVGPWKALPIALYAACAAAFAITFGPDLREQAQLAKAAGLAAAGIMIAALILQTKSHGEPGGKREFYRWLAPLLGLIVLLHGIDLVRHFPPFAIVQELLPAVLLFLLAYQIQPLTFDVLIKEVTFYFFVLATVYAAWWILPVWFIRHRDAYPALILCVWPIVSAAPWFHRKWVRWLDKVVLGRELTSTEARTLFLVGLEGAVTEDDLARSGERTLQQIFGAPVQIALNRAVAPRNGKGMRAAVRLGSEFCGAIDVAPRQRQLQFMGEDVALLESLAGEYSILLENLRLREKKLYQERKEKDLQILATRSELKALRAQINPHFLFNSLSAIAGLISKDPSRARETVEQLAEVFRYSLYRSDKEWVRLADELEFVAAYLDVERARFGPRLQVEIRVEESARRVHVPAMVLQVLVENAIKHGVSTVRGPGIVTIRGECRGERLWLEVRDNGIGPDPEWGATNGRGSGGSGSGFGLRNVQERLNLYFKGDGTLRMSREESTTVVTLEMPIASTPDPIERPHP